MKSIELYFKEYTIALLTEDAEMISRVRNHVPRILTIAPWLGYFYLRKIKKEIEFANHMENGERQLIEKYKQDIDNLKQ